MTIFLPEDGQDQIAPPALAPATGFWERVTAAGKKAWIEADTWNRSRLIADSYEAELRDSLPQDPAHPWRQSSGRHRENREIRRSRLFAVIKSLQIGDPETYGKMPTTEEGFQAEVLNRRRQEYAEQQDILDRAPGDAFAAETLGELWAGFSDPLSIATLPIGGPEAKGFLGLLKTMGLEAGLAAGTELLQDPQRRQVAADLDLPEPDTLSNMLTGALGAAGLVGTVGALAAVPGLMLRGATRLERYRAAKGTGAGVSKLDREAPGDHEAAVAAAGKSLQDGQTAAPVLPEIGPDAPPNWAAIRGGIFAGESGGDFNALSGYSNRDGGPFANVKITEMTVDQALEFADPRGKYAAWVRARIGRTATPMGAYQIVGTTLRAVKEGLGLRGDELMTPDLQERMGQWIYRNQGTGAWEGYRGPNADFQPGEPRRYGGEFSVYRPSSRGYTGEGQIAVGDRSINVEYVVVDASLLRKAEGRFQPRDRSRIASDAWISDTAGRLDPAKLMPAPTADKGAPLVGPDNMIESGNGRFSAILRAYDQHPERAAAYRAQIEAAGFAIPEGTARPVLIARRQTGLTDAERVQLTVDAQDTDVARMTPTELAQTTARQMTADRMASFRPEARLTDEANQPFLQQVLSALPRSERNAMFDAGGALNAEGRRRLSQAFFARAWDDGGPMGRQVLERFAEAEDAGELKSLMDALTEASPAWATLRAGIEAGEVRAEFDITPQVLDAMQTIAAARADAARFGGTIAAALDAIRSQSDLFSGPNPLSVALLTKFWRDGRAAPAAEIGRFLTRYAEDARKAGKTGDMLGARPSEVLRALDSRAFADLPDDIPPLEIAAPPPRAEDAALPETAFAKGADSPEAEAGDGAALADLMPAAEAPDVLAAALDSARAEFADLQLKDEAGKVLWRAADDLGAVAQHEKIGAAISACQIGGG